MIIFSVAKSTLIPELPGTRHSLRIIAGIFYYIIAIVTFCEFLSDSIAIDRIIIGQVIFYQIFFYAIAGLNRALRICENMITAVLPIFKVKLL